MERFFKIYQLVNFICNMRTRQPSPGLFPFINSLLAQSEPPNCRAFLLDGQNGPYRSAGTAEYHRWIIFIHSKNKVCKNYPKPGCHSYIPGKPEVKKLFSNSLL
ncbi:MAG: hypothetical protein B5M56_00440 [Desulfococcus sp. 4484_241]|nr:MAG: hypothetical protein B5M56_00440 [Desulfococcus sp. 4484_241]